MPIKIKEIKKGILHRLICEDDKSFNDTEGKIAVVFAQKELLDMIDNRIRRLTDYLKKQDITKIKRKRREISITKTSTRIIELVKIRGMITTSVTLRRNKGYWWG